MTKRVLCLLLTVCLTLGLTAAVGTPVSAEPTVTAGDVNADGYVDSADARLILRHVAGMITLNETQLLAADATENGIVNKKDADALWMLIYKADRLSPALNGESEPDSEKPSEASAETSEILEEPHSAADRTTVRATSTTAKAVKPTSGKTTAAAASASKTTATTTVTTAKTTAETTAKTTVKTTVKTTKPTTKPTAPPSGGAKPQAVPTMAAVTSPPAAPSLKQSPVAESVYTSKIRVVNNRTGRVYTGKTKADLQLAVTADVKYEIGNSRSALVSTEAWKAHAVASYTRICSVCYDGSAFGINLAQDVDLSIPNDKKIYDAVGAVLGIKLMDLSASGDYNKLCTVFYSASCAGTSSSCHKVFVANLPYAQAVFSPETQDRVDYYYGTSGNYVSTYTDTFANIVADVSDYVGKKIYADEKSELYPLYATEWDGAYVARSNLYYLDGSGNKVYIKGMQIRSALGLRSHSFAVTSQSGDKLTLTVKGHGHGLGLSQMGAVIYANDYGWSYSQILAHYFSITPGSSHQLCKPNW
ncbi:MAG: hypothetical protein IKI63_03980 [Clostridia bacterium]|nr:hypothetical protein [Clostridia bacterium]